jgi:hypothetical protein
LSLCSAAEAGAVAAAAVAAAAVTAATAAATRAMKVCTHGHCYQICFAQLSLQQQMVVPGSHAGTWHCSQAAADDYLYCTGVAHSLAQPSCSLMKGFCLM